jgi:succinoglycan biosynthesis protein ExoM
MSESTGPRVAVCLATFKRPAELARILPVLVQQRGELSPRPSIIVVDNDPGAGAREQVAEAIEAFAVGSSDRPGGDSGITYVHEPTPGIAAARNAAVDAALADGMDAVIFVDDDEVPLPGWLSTLVGAWREWGCAGVAGPVIAVLEGAPDPWIDASGVFERVTRPSGSLIPGAATNNLLLDLHVLERHGLRFDPGYGLSGGSDTRLTHQLVGRGLVLKWCDEAEVLDYIPPSRCTRAWVTERTVRTSNSYTRSRLDLAREQDREVAMRVVLTARGVKRIVTGNLGLLGARLRPDTVRHARAMMTIATGQGILRGIRGKVTYGYRRN